MYNRKLVFAAACTGLFLFGMTLITLGSILPELGTKFTNASGDRSGVLTYILPIGILLGSLVFGPLADRNGYKLLLILSIAISAIALEGIAFTSSFGVLCLCIFFIGFGGGIINGGTSALVADISEKNKGASLSILGVFFGVGAVGMPLLLGILSKRFDYTEILAATGIFMIVPIIYMLLLRFPPPKQGQSFSLNEGLGLLKEPALLLTSFFLFFQSGTESLINNWTTSFLQYKLEAKADDALYALSFYMVGLSIARILLGGLLRKYSSFSLMGVSLMIVIAGALILGLTNSYNAAFAALIIMGAGLAAGFPVILSYIGQLYSALSGTAFSIAFVIALVGNTLINYIFDMVAGKENSELLPWLLVICSICMLTILFLIKRKIGKGVR